MSLTSIRFSHIPFSADVFRMRIKFSVIHVYAHTCICPDKAAQMYFDRISLEHVLGMINFPQIVQTMIIQIICVYTYFAMTRSNNYRTNYSSISATETKIVSPKDNFCRQRVIDMRRYRNKLLILRARPQLKKQYQWPL